MLQTKYSLVLAASLAAALLAGCGGSGSASGNQSPKIQYSSAVVFGDSLSDVGTYATPSNTSPSGLPGLLALGGGRYTVNAFTGTAPVKSNWTELLSAQLNLPAPCPYEVGLNGSAFSYGPVTTPTCTSYAMGGALVNTYIVPGYPTPGNVVSAEFGIGNVNNPVDGSPTLGQLTRSIGTQMQEHLTVHGKYTGNEVVFVLAGGNDGILNTMIFLGFAPSQGVNAAATNAVTAMGIAGATLAGEINNYVLAAGAKHVVVLNLPDLSTTPFANFINAQPGAAGTSTLINTMVTTFNSQLKAGLTSPDVLLVDINTVSTDQIMHPAQYGLSNVTDPACNLNYPANPFATQGSPESGTSLVCNASNVIAGDISHYEFADLVHPTPYGNSLIARYVASQMAIKGWL
jgi:phospholipase/lecithinase/hemolysin